MIPGTGSRDALGALTAPAFFRSRVAAALRALDDASIPRRVWARDHTVWRDDPAEIVDRLGWLGVAGEMRAELPRIQEWADRLSAADVGDVVLLGMGGSSLAPEVFRRTFRTRPSRPMLHVLDSTSPAWIRRVTGMVDARRLHVIVASKSGTTIEVESATAHFRELVRGAAGDAWAESFTAITDPGTPLASLASEQGFRAAFLNPPDIGGRFSALSKFGLVPASVLGVDLPRLLDGAERMASASGPDVPAARNPGAVLGAVLGVGVETGRDKMTLLSSTSLAAFGVWVEQLLAESTGKDGTGIIPVVDEPELPAKPGDDRVFVSLSVARGEDPAREERVTRLASQGHPWLRLEIPDLEGLGGEMFRWEMATAIAGHALRIHPFDQPDVQTAKTRTAEILRALTEGERPPAPEPGDAGAVLSERRPPEWIGLMVYGEPSPSLRTALEDLRRALGASGCATTVGLGPRFLHSTGQLHKGGPNTGRFLQLVLDEPSLPIPGRRYGFLDLMRAQADGDLAALRERGRPVARIESGRDPVATVRALTAAIHA